MASQGIKDKKILILGTDTDALSIANFLVNKGALVSLYDDKFNLETKEELLAPYAQLKNIEINVGDFQAKYLEGQNWVLYGKTYALAQNFINDIRQSGMELLSFLDFLGLFVTAPIVLVAGTSGRKTTAHVIEKMLVESGKKVLSNVSSSLGEILSSTPDFIVLALETLLIDDFRHLKARALVFLNLAEELPEHFPNLNDYLLWQRRVLKCVDSETIFVLNSQDLNIVSFVQGVQGRTLFFGAQEVPEGFEGAWSNKKSAFVRTKDSSQAQIFDISQFRIRGPHNRENLMAAILAATSLGVKSNSIQKALEEVKTLPHRLQFVKSLNAVAFYNDSAATNSNAVSRALYSFSEPVILIMGGKDVPGNFGVLAPHVRLKVKNLILVGEAKERVNRALGDFTETFLVGTMEEAILISYQKSRSGDVILLSPGCPAGDVYKSFEERGDFFRNMILGLTQIRKPHVI
jgi:UDP-N-acetylmuramoylalanine--D-glutamate ligase